MVYLLSIVPSPYGYGTKSERREWWSDGTVGKGIYGNEVSRVKVLICLPSREAHFIPCQLPSSSVSWSSVTFLGCPSTLATLATRSPTPSPYPPEGHRGKPTESEVDDEATRTWPIGREKDRTIRNPKEPKRLRTKWDWKWRILIIQLFSYPVNLDPTISPLIKSYPNA